MGGRGRGSWVGTGVVVVELVGPEGRVGPSPRGQRDASGDDVHLRDEGAVHDQILLGLAEAEGGSLRLDVHGKAWRRKEVVVDAVAPPEVGLTAVRKVEVPVRAT